MSSGSDHQATVIDGKAIAQTIRSEIASEIKILSEKYGKVGVFLYALFTAIMHMNDELLSK